jgi:hypothetical protein
VGQLAGEDVALAGLPPADRDFRAGLGEIELGELAGAVGGALEGAGLAVERSQLADAIVEDRLAAVVAELGADLAQPLR